MSEPIEFPQKPPSTEMLIRIGHQAIKIVTTAKIVPAREPAKVIPFNKQTGGTSKNR